MHKPGGYLVGHGPEGIEHEADTFSCRHCNRVVQVGARERGADIGGFCRCCTGLICGPCVDDGRCIPLEKRLQAHERRADTLRSYGLM
jgi:hypothetical protein